MHRKPNRVEGGLVFDWLTAMLRPVSHIMATVPIPNSNSRVYQNCAIPVRTRIVQLYNSGTRFLPELLLQFWDVPELSVNYFPIAC